jgi:hypothetical protein
MGRTIGESERDSKLYQPPFQFAARILEVIADVSRKVIRDTGGEQKAFAKAAIVGQ